MTLGSLGATPAQLPRPEVVEHRGEPQPGWSHPAVEEIWSPRDSFCTVPPRLGGGAGMGGQGVEPQHDLGLERTLKTI